MTKLELQERVTELEREVRIQGNELDNYLDEVEELNEDIDELEQEIEKLQEKIEAIQSPLPNYSLDDAMKLELLNEMWANLTYEKLSSLLSDLK